MRKAGDLLRFAGAYLRANVQSALEYRVSFFTQVFAMMLNDAMWLVFWLAYFDRFPLVEGWGRDEIVTLWAVVAAGFGVATTLCGNLFRVATAIMRGELDFYLAQPKPVLPHLLISRMSITAPGDVLFGVIGFAWIVRPDPQGWILFGVTVLTTATIFVSFGVATQSLAFFLGNAEALAAQLSGALINFSTYPTVIFRGAIKVVLFTVIPAGFVAYVPVTLIHEFSWPTFALLAVFTMVSVGLAGLLFRAGLRRYESGNLVLTRE